MLSSPPEGDTEPKTLCAGSASSCRTEPGRRKHLSPFLHTFEVKETGRWTGRRGRLGAGGTEA